MSSNENFDLHQEKNDCEMKMTESIENEIAQIMLELKIPRYGFQSMQGCKKKRSAIAVAAGTSLESPLPSSPKPTKITTSAASLSLFPVIDHSDPDYNPIRKRKTAKKISLKRKIKNVDKESKLNLKETKEEASEVVAEMVNEMDMVQQMSDDEIDGVDGPTEIPDLNIPYEPLDSDSIEGLDVNAAIKNKESK